MQASAAGREAFATPFELCWSDAVARWGSAIALRWWPPPGAAGAPAVVRLRPCMASRPSIRLRDVGFAARPAVCCGAQRVVGSQQRLWRCAWIATLPRARQRWWWIRQRRQKAEYVCVPEGILCPTFEDGFVTEVAPRCLLCPACVDATWPVGLQSRTLDGCFNDNATRPLGLKSRTFDGCFSDTAARPLGLKSRTFDECFSDNATRQLGFQSRAFDGGFSDNATRPVGLQSCTFKGRFSDNTNRPVELLSRTFDDTDLMIQTP